MDQYERAMLKAACLEAAAKLLAASSPQTDRRPGFANVPPAPDTAACVKYARDLFAKLTDEKWD